MKFEKRTTLTLTEKEQNILADFFEFITDEYDDVDFNCLLEDIWCKRSTYTKGCPIIDIKYEEN